MAELTASGVIIRRAQPGEYDAARALYEICGYGGGIRDEDAVFIALAGSELVGTVRLCPEEGELILRGMQVHPRWQGQGIGRALLRACLPHIRNRTVYCLPYTHLTAFYEAVGFEVVEANELPPFLAHRLAGYLAQGQRLLAMRRTAVPAAAEASAQQAAKPA